MAEARVAAATSGSDAFAAAGRWPRLHQAFADCHRQRLNVYLHLLTLAATWFASASLAAAVSPWLAAALTGLYVLALLVGVWRDRMDAAVWLASTLFLTAVSLAAWWARVDWVAALCVLGAAYVVQELAHLLAGEPTMQSRYVGRPGWWETLLGHTFYLLPLTLASVPGARGHLLSFLVPRDRVFHTRLTDADQTAALAELRQWVEQAHPTMEHTTHWWLHELPEHVAAAFGRVGASEELHRMLGEGHGPAYAVQVLPGMSEVYVTGPTQKMTSDTVFYTPHVDGPWAVYPFAAVYRCMVAASPNDRVTTHFPMAGGAYDRPRGLTLTTGDAVAFDFNREPHYITRAAGSAGHRINLKLHYLVCPSWLKPYGRLLGWLTTRYDVRARKLFLDTISPDSLLAKLGAAWVLASTKLFEWTVRHVGFTNLTYVLAAAAAAWAASSYAVFLAATSFVHYLLYVAVFADRRDVSFGRFVRNARFFKTLSFAQLFGLYAWHFAATPQAWASVAIMAGGFGTAAAAYRVLGTLRTYFGQELGHCAARRLTAFPYGVVPHPMILGSVVGLAGMLLATPFRDAYAWLAVTHVGLYLAHLAQEVATTDADGREPPAAA